MAAVKTQPGVMLYFDLIPSLSHFSDEDLGLLFKAILLYASTGEGPNFQGKPVDVAWSFIKPRIDRDHDAYLEKAGKSRYAAYTRVEKARGFTPMSYDEWLIDERIRTLPPASMR